MPIRSSHLIIRKHKQSLWKLIFDRKQTNTLNSNQPTKILFDQTENLIGDMIVNTVAFRALKRAHPDWTIHVLAGGANRDIIRTNPNVDHIHLFTGTLSVIKQLRQEKFDIYYCHKNRLALGDFILLRYIGSRINIGRNKSGFRLFDYSIDQPAETEVDRYVRFLNFLGIDDIDRRYDLHLTQEELSWGRSYVETLSGWPIVVFNRYGNRRGKLFGRARAKQMIAEILRAYPGAAIVLLYSPATKTETVSLQRELDLDAVQAATTIRTIRDSAAIIRYADLIVTPDTSIVHIACAFDKPQICAYRDQVELKLWRPMSNKAIVLLPRRPSRHVDDVESGEFSRALVTAQKWLVPHPPAPSPV